MSNPDFDKMATEEQDSTGDYQQIVDKVRHILDVADENLHARYEVYKAKEAFQKLVTIVQTPVTSAKDSEESVGYRKTIDDQNERIAQLESEMDKMQQQIKCLTTTLRAMESWSSLLINQSSKPNCKKIK